jgi:hypothetical protein
VTYCTKCGAMNPDDAIFCNKCGSQLPLAQNTQASQSKPGTPTVNNYYYGRQRRRDRRQSGQGGSGRGMVAPFIFAAIFIVIGMAVFLPNLPWQWFWGALWLMIGGLIVGFWALRRSQGRVQQSPQMVG